MGAKVNNYVVIDFETGGLSEEKNPIMEIAIIAIDGDTLEEIDRFESFCKSYDNLTYEPGALKANGLSVAEVNKKGLTVEELVEKVIEFILIVNTNNSKAYKPVFVAHNAKFDFKFFNYIFKRQKQDVFKYIDEDIVDTVKLARMMFGTDIENHKLGTVCQKAGIDLSDAHRAMADTEATAEFLKLCINKMRSTGAIAGSKEEVVVKEKFQF